MKGSIALNLAISLDGYLSDPDGGYDWIAGQGDPLLDTANEIAFGDFIADVDVVVMGHRSYEQGFAADHTDRQVLVAAHAEQPDAGNVRFLSGDIVTPVLALRDAGKRVYLFGGGISVDPFLKADVIDEYIIGIIPVLLGTGRPLFLGGSPTLPLRLMEYSVRDGVTVLRYIRRR